MKKPTISEIKSAISETSPFFFNRKTMKGFGQTMKSFTVAKSPNDNIYIYAPSYDGDRLMGYSFRRFTGTDLKLIPNRPNYKSLSEILDYIENN
jgi:hypothetical protein